MKHRPEANHPRKTAEKIRRLIAACEQEEPPFSSLGTPYVGLNKAAQEIIDLGSAAIAPLLALLPSALPHSAASIAFCLGQLGDRKAIPLLKETLNQYEAKQEKGPYDYAFIGNARTALDMLGRK
jgi:HEAT repeat protein